MQCSFSLPVGPFSSQERSTDRMVRDMQAAVRRPEEEDIVAIVPDVKALAVTVALVPMSVLRAPRPQVHPCLQSKLLLGSTLGLSLAEESAASLPTLLRLTSFLAISRLGTCPYAELAAGKVAGKVGARGDPVRPNAHETPTLR